MNYCVHGKDKDECLICWAEFNNELEALRIASGLSREEFGAVIRKCVEQNKKKERSNNG